MNPDTKIILDVNGVIMSGAMPVVVRFCLGEILRFRMNPFVFISLMYKAAFRTGKLTVREKSHVVAFAQTPYYKKMKFLPGAVETCRRLIAECPGGVHICCANSFSPDSDYHFAQFLTQEIGRFADIHFVPPLGSKADYYRTIRDKFPTVHVIVVDDSARHIEDARRLGLDVRFINKQRGYRNLEQAFYGNGGCK